MLYRNNASYSHQNTKRGSEDTSPWTGVIDNLKYRLETSLVAPNIYKCVERCP